MEVATKDYYSALGVAKTATTKEISAAFKKLAKQYHPDVSKDPKASEKFKEINEAYSILNDAEKRKKYDEFGNDFESYEGWERAGRPGGAFYNQGPRTQYRNMSPEEMGNAFGGFDFADIFGGQFGGRPTSRQGQNVEGEVTITLEEAYAGTARTVQMDGRQVEVRIPAGIRDGARVRAAGQGGKGSRGGNAGDLLIGIHIAQHQQFIRKGDDLETKVEVPLKTALLGGEVQVPTLSGKRVSLTVPAETQNGTKLRMRGLGMPKLKGQDQAKGDLYAEVNVRLPLPLTPESRDAASKLGA